MNIIESGSRKGKESLLSDDRGMTMAELIIIVAIITILMGVAFISIIQYQRSLAQLERDKISKEIFIAAQNHLTILKGEGYLDTVTGTKAIYYGTEDTTTKEEVDGVEKDIEEDYYVIYDGNTVIPNDNSTILSQMLPFGSIDETIRAGGSYIIHYQRSTGLILDVFYCSRSGSPDSFNYTLKDNSDYVTVMGMRGPENKASRRDWNKHVLGWYGGADAADLPSTTLEPPEIKVINSDRLYVKIKNKNYESDGVTPKGSIRILIEGVLSGTVHYLNVDMTDDTHNSGNYTGFYEKDYILDEITTKYEIGSTKTGGHFAERTFDDMSGGENGFIPGEDIKIKAVAFCVDSLANIAYSEEILTNSLYESVAKENPSDPNAALTTAYVSSIRHLENLDKDISDLDKNDSTGNKLNITTGIQTRNMNWTEFCNNITSTGTVNVYTLTDDDGTNDNCYRPVTLYSGFSYDGSRYSISNINADTEKAGLIGNSSNVTISNLELIDFNITGSASAGALAGTLTSSTVTNVLARNSNSDASIDRMITSTGYAGGLIGNASEGTISYCAAAMRVGGTSDAGGLIGTSSADVTGCYSAGHTKDGLYEKWIYKKYNNDNKDDGLEKGFDVVGANVGGLIGSVTGGSVSHCYSTCSVSGTGNDNAGGLVGSKSNGSISECYCTGYMDQSGEKKPKAFIGSGSVAAGSNNKYLSIINETESEDGKTREYLDPGSETGITAIDEDTKAYEDFVGGTWKMAKPYDSVALGKYYDGRYNLQTVEQLDAAAPVGGWDQSTYFVKMHYGDWPAPEIFVINKK